jgi:hypothetical protein
MLIYCYFAKYFVPLHRPMRLTLVRIAKFQQMGKYETQRQLIRGLFICAYLQVFGDTLRGHGWQSTFLV